MSFNIIKNIELNNSQSWEKKIFLTFDLDWANDEVLSYTLDILEENKIKATFFITHDTCILERLRSNSDFELGIHPNFNYLLNGNLKLGSNIQEIIQDIKRIVPEAISVRSHSVTQSSLLCETFKKSELVYDCNNFIPFKSEIILKPYEFLENFIKVTYFWEDDTHVYYGEDWNVNKYLNRAGLKIFNFHPIHIFLNTKNLKQYEISRPYFNDINGLKKIVNHTTYGVKNFFLDLIKTAKTNF